MITGKALNQRPMCMYIPRLEGTSNNSFVGRIALSRSDRNPHVPGRTLRLLRSGPLAACRT